MKMALNSQLQSSSVVVTPARCAGLQRKCSCGGGKADCEDCKKKKAVQRHAAHSGTGTTSPGFAPPIVHDALRSPGQPLDAKTRAYFEPRFGHDFSRVRIHADSQAARSAQAVQALAYTVGQDIFFAADQFAPETNQGNRLLAHELTHTIQQSRNGSASESVGPLAVNNPTDASEHEANAMAESVSRADGSKSAPTSGPVSLSAMPASVLQRECSGNNATTCSGRCTASDGKIGSCVFNSMPRWCKCLNTAYLRMIPAWLLGLLGAAALVALGACFASGACEFGIVVGGLGTAAAAALLAILKKAGFRDTGGSAATASAANDASQPAAGSADNGGSASQAA